MCLFDDGRRYTSRPERKINTCSIRTSKSMVEQELLHLVQHYGNMMLL
jgi:hypothetical protein